MEKGVDPAYTREATPSPIEIKLGQRQFPVFREIQVVYW